MHLSTLNSVMILRHALNDNKILPYLLIFSFLKVHQYALKE